MIEHRRLGGAGRARVVVARNGVQELGPHGGLERFAALLDQPQPEMHVTEQAPLVRLAEDRAASELARASDVVHERGRKEEVASKPLV